MWGQTGANQRIPTWDHEVVTKYNKNNLLCLLLNSKCQLSYQLLPWYNKELEQHSRRCFVLSSCLKVCYQWPTKLTYAVNLFFFISLIKYTPRAPKCSITQRSGSRHRLVILQIQLWLKRAIYCILGSWSRIQDLGLLCFYSASQNQ